MDVRLGSDCALLACCKLTCAYHQETCVAGQDLWHMRKKCRSIALLLGSLPARPDAGVATPASAVGYLGSSAQALAALLHQCSAGAVLLAMG